MISCGSYLDLHGAGGECCDLLLHPVTDTWVHGGATGQHVIGVQVLTDVDVALHDAIVGGFMDACRLHAYRETAEGRCDNVCGRYIQYKT